MHVHHESPPMYKAPIWIKYFELVGKSSGVSAAAGGITGWTQCHPATDSSTPMVNERIASAVMLALLWTSSMTVAPFYIPYQLLSKYENSKRGKNIDVLDMFKYQKAVATNDRKWMKDYRSF